MAGARVPLIFRIFKGDQLVREERLSQNVIKIGKVPSAHLKVDDETVSRMHAIIEVNGPGDISIIDLGSTKGTFVNNHKVNKAKLVSGDNIVVGETRIEFVIGTEEIEEAPFDAGFEAPRPASTTGSPFAAAGLPPAPPAFDAPRAANVTGSPFAATAAAAPARAAAGYGGGMSGMGHQGYTPAPMFAAPTPDSYEDAAGPRAVEIAAMLGDSVVKVQHCTKGSGGKVSGATWGLIGVSAVTLLAAGYAFFTGIGNANYNAAKLATWTGKLKKPEFSFRPEMLSFSYDYILVGGLIAGLFTLVYGLIKARRELDVTPQFRIGTAAGVEFPIDTVPAPSFPLVAPAGNDFVVSFGAGMEGDMSLDGQTASLADLVSMGRARPATATAGAYEMAIPDRARFRIRSGQTTFLVSSVAQPKAQKSGMMAGFEALVLLFVGGSALAHIAFLFLINSAGGDASIGGGDGDNDEDISMRSASTAQDNPPPPPPEDQPEDNGEEESGGTGTAMALDEGKMGKKDSTRAEGQYKMARTAEQEQLARTQAVEQARTAGILGSSALLQGGAFASLTGTGDVSSGFDDVDVFGGLLGNEAGEMNGGFGFGRSGFGPGGGGTGWGTIGTGRYGTIGHGSGTGSGYGVGGGRGGGRGHTASVPTVSIGQPDSVGDLDKAIIRRYIKRNEAKITNCYERVLLAKPGLSGTVMTQFFISPNGTVASASGKGVDGDVANCVAGVIKNIEFPKPKGGGGVQVNYPFNFRVSGS